MKKPETKQSALQRLAQRVQESGGDFPALMQQLRQALAGTGGMREKAKDTFVEDFDAVLAEALRVEAPPVCLAPAALPSAKPDDEEEWKKFERELEQELIRKFNL
jgi:hypothetical protein